MIIDKTEEYFDSLNSALIGGSAVVASVPPKKSRVFSVGVQRTLTQFYSPYGEFYCFAVVFVLLQVVLPSAV